MTRPGLGAQEGLRVALEVRDPLPPLRAAHPRAHEAHRRDADRGPQEDLARRHRQPLERQVHFENDHRLALVFEPIFTDSDPHHKIELHKPPIVRENSSNWYVGPTANAEPSTPDTTTGDAAAHEFGHLVGLEDEYRLTAAEFKRLVGRDPTRPTRTPTSATPCRG